MKLKIAQFFTTMLFALVMGVFWGTWFTLSRSIEGFQPQTFLDIGQTAIRNLAVPMATLMPLSLLSAFIMLALLPKRSIAFVFAIVAVLLMVVALVVTLAVEVPIDNQIKVWTVATLPANWEGLRNRWEFYHGVRTLVSIFALAFVTTCLEPIGCASSRAGSEAGAIRGSVLGNGAEAPASGACNYLLTYLLYSAYFTKTTSHLK